VASTSLLPPPVQHEAISRACFNPPVMNSGSPTSSNALPQKSGASSPQSSRYHPVRSPSDRLGSSIASPSKSPTPNSAKSRPRRSIGDLNGDANSDTFKGHNDSEAETIIDDHVEGQETSRAKKRPLRDEPNEDARPSSPSWATRSEPYRSHPGSRASSVAVDPGDRSERRLNGVKAKENGFRNGTSQPGAHGKARSLTEAEAKSSRAQSADAFNSPAQEGQNRHRHALSAEPRKRKFSDGSLPSKERPRQKPRLDGPSKDRAPSPQNDKFKSSSPATSTASGVRYHKRSASTQSHLPTAPSSAPPRPRRDTHSTASGERATFTDTSSEPASPRPPPIPLLAAPRSKLSSRALVSPARSAMPHGKKTDKFGLTALARACERGNLKSVRSAYDASPDELDFVDNAGYAPLQKAALEGHADIVEFLLDKGCKKDCQSKNQDTPLIDAVENGHIEVVRLLLRHGVNPHHQNDRGQRAIDLIDHEQDEAEEIEVLLQKAMLEYEGPESDDEKHAEKLAPSGKRGERKDLLHKENTAKTLLDYAQRGDIEAVDYFLNMRVKPNIDCCVAAARGGHDTILNLLLVDVSDKDPDPASYEETPLLAAIGRGHLKVVRLLLDQQEFNPCRRTREGKTYWETAEERRGPKWQTERDLLRERYDQYRATHPARGGKKPRADALNGPNHGRTSISSKVDTKAFNVTSPKLAHKPKPKLDRNSKSDEVPRRRLLSARELSMKDRRRRVVHEESSDGDSEYDEDDEVRAPVKSIGRRRKSSTASKALHSEKDRDEKPSPPKKANKHYAHEKREKPEKRVARKGPSSESPSSERRKRIDVSDKISDKTHSPDVEMKDVPFVPVKEETPEYIREERRAAERAEAERIQREKEEAEAKKAEDERRRKEEEERIRQEEEEARRRHERLDSLPAALRFALKLGSNRPLTFSTGYYPEEAERSVEGMDFNFLPILHWPLSQIDPDCPTSRQDEKWIMSFHVIGLFGLPELHLDEFPDWEKRPVPDEQREMFLRGYCIDKLAHFYHIDPEDALDEMDVDINEPNGVPTEKESPNEGTPGVKDNGLRLDTSVSGLNSSLAARKASNRLNTYYTAIEEAKDKFRKMQPLYYVRYEDFSKALQSKYPHLRVLEITACRGPPIRPNDRPKWFDKLRKSSTPRAPTPTSRGATPRALTPKVATPKEPNAPQELAPKIPTPGESNVERDKSVDSGRSDNPAQKEKVEDDVKLEDESEGIPISIKDMVKESMDNDTDMVDAR
jgi:ankyrin repeat protein